MKREILFRGKRIDNGEWIEGSLLNFRENTYIIPHDSEYCYDNTENLAFDVEYFEVLSETVGQYTGRKDKNGRKIFEGDILEAFNRNKGYVVFKNGAFTKSCSPKDMPYLIANDVNAVIGNIHDNPELMKGD